VSLLAKKYDNKFNYRKKFIPNIKSRKAELAAQSKRRKEYYTEDWNIIRRRVYIRDSNRCVLCGKKGKLNAHHIIPVKISKDNSMSNLVTVCDVCHRRLEAIGYAILERGGGQTDVRRAELTIITEARKARLEKYMDKREQIIEKKNNKNGSDTKSISEDNERPERDKKD